MKTFLTHSRQETIELGKSFAQSLSPGSVVGRAIDPIRFRANLYIDGAPEWAEFGWAGREVTVGGARLRIVRPIERCAATNVNPATAVRDLNLPLALKRGFGHVTMGVFAVVTAGGEVAVGDAVEPSPAPAAFNLSSRQLGA